jgi:hypothetical protein
MSSLPRRTPPPPPPARRPFARRRPFPRSRALWVASLRRFAAAACLCVHTLARHFPRPPPPLVLLRVRYPRPLAPGPVRAPKPPTISMVVVEEGGCPAAGRAPPFRDLAWGAGSRERAAGAGVAPGCWPWSATGRATPGRGRRARARATRRPGSHTPSSPSSRRPHGLRLASSGRALRVTAPPARAEGWVGRRAGRTDRGRTSTAKCSSRASVAPRCPRVRTRVRIRARAVSGAGHPVRPC